MYFRRHIAISTVSAALACGLAIGCVPGTVDYESEPSGSDDEVASEDTGASSLPDAASSASSDDPDERDPETSTGDPPPEPGAGESQESRDSVVPNETPQSVNDADNMLTNPGFEEGAGGDGCPAGWNCTVYDAGSRSEFSAVESDVHTGSAAARWEGDGSPIALFKQTHSAEPGERYEVSAWVKGENLESAPFIQVLFDDAEGELLDHESFVADTSLDEWVRISAKTSEAPEGTAELRFNLSVRRTGGTVQWDEASLAVAEPENLLENPSFEGETRQDDCPAAWNCTIYEAGSQSDFGTDTSTARDGETSARWDGDGTPIVLFKQSLSAEPGNRYEVSAQVRGADLESAPFIQVLFDDADGNPIAHESFEAEGAEQWTEIAAETSGAPAGTARIRFNLSIRDTGGTVRWDDAGLFLTETGDAPDSGSDSDTEPAEFEVVPARGQTVNLTDGQVYENKLIDFTTGGDFTIDTTNATNWTIRNVGFKGRKQSAGTVFGVADVKGGTSVIENVYLGDGSGRNGGRATCPDNDCTHGPVGIWVDPDHSGHLVMRNINVQGWPNNGIYGSAPGSNGNGQRGTIHIDECYGANNYVASFRIAGSNGNRITDSVAFNDGDGYDGRPLWIWKPGPIEVSGMHIDSGSSAHAMVAGAWSGGTEVRLRDSQVRGNLRERNGSTIITSNVGNNPDLTPPDGVPTSPKEAAGGRAGQ